MIGNVKVYIVDTHSLLWYFLDSTKLSLNANKAFEDVEIGKARLIIPAIVIAEVIYLVKNGKIDTDLDGLIQRIQESDNFQIFLLGIDILLCLKNQENILEMHDSLIICEAIINSATIITKDWEITDSKLVEVVW